MTMFNIDKRKWEETLWNALSCAKEFLSYLLIPVAVPFVFAQEILSFLREKVGLSQRTMEGKVVLITGASSGIGECLAKSFYKAGCQLILASRRYSELDRVKNELVRMKTDGRVHVPATLVIDVEDLESLPKKCQQAVNIYGRIDILINNAGISVRGTVLDTDLQVQKQIMNVNYFGPLVLTKELLPQMIARRSGNIVFISSIQGRISIPDRSGYAASKHAIQALADSLRAEVYKNNIQVHVISPGYVKTNISVNSLTSSGSLYGQMDQTTESGYDPNFVAERTYKAILCGEKELIIAKFIPKAAVFLRYLLPNVYFYLMTRRVANKSK